VGAAAAAGVTGAEAATGAGLTSTLGTAWGGRIFVSMIVAGGLRSVGATSVGFGAINASGNFSLGGSGAAGFGGSSILTTGLGVGMGIVGVGG
jgi:hypothetical protein